ncbi:hypothetical protein WS70_07295 [Burkholderia mayonis]|uniref:Uncharacterized protein n=1 Tax=Burkholderia mayonis TaxID=1385591 RepID=A0A1B4FDI7_9BURK|nr:hypothetical protein WS70_07295 [Burkholderia mayonis]KVE40594.1 hypothetical protein WS69_28670 [Burkholderia sp. BDU5]KVE47488.1 hypothetical protein WS70_27115 [Burkholderia mayonis]
MFVRASRMRSGSGSRKPGGRSNMRSPSNAFAKRYVLRVQFQPRGDSAAHGEWRPANCRRESDVRPPVAACPRYVPSRSIRFQTVTSSIQKRRPDFEIRKPR